MSGDGADRERKEKDKTISSILEYVTSDNSADEDFARTYKQLEKESKISEDMAARENDGIIRMRRTWSGWILFFIGAIVFFDFGVVVAYGMGFLVFHDSNVVIAIVTESVVKVIGLGAIITNNLFKKIFK